MDKTKYLFIQCGQKHWNFVTVQCPHSYKMFQIYFKSAGALLIWKWRNTFIIIHHKCKKRKKIVEIKRSLCRRLLFVNVYLIFISDKDIFQNKQYSQYIHQYADFLFLSFTCNNVDDHGSLTVGYQKKVPAGRIKPAFFVSNFWFLSIVFYCNVL